MHEIRTIIYAVVADKKQTDILVPFHYCFSCGMCYKEAGTCFSGTKETPSQIANLYEKQMPH